MSCGETKNLVEGRQAGRGKGAVGPGRRARKRYRGETNLQGAGHYFKNNRDWPEIC